MNPEKFLPEEIQSFVNERDLVWLNTSCHADSRLTMRVYRFYSHAETGTRICIILLFYRTHQTEPWEFQDVDILVPVTFSTDQGELLKALATYLR